MNYLITITELLGSTTLLVNEDAELFKAFMIIPALLIAILLWEAGENYFNKKAKEKEEAKQKEEEKRQRKLL